MRNGGTSKSSSSPKLRPAPASSTSVSTSPSARRDIAAGAVICIGLGRGTLDTVKTGSDHSHAHLVAHALVDYLAENDVGVGVGGRVNYLRRFVDLEQARGPGHRRC